MIMNKGIFLLLSAILLSTISFAQNRVPLLEHFTNTRCGICGGTNPAFYNKVSMATQSSFHHISYHTKIPYSTCVLYSANKVEQDARGSFYSLSGTPSVSINGKGLVSLSSVDNNTISQNGTGTAAVSIDVTETTGSNRTATIKLTAHQSLSANGYKLYAALVEKKLNYNAPNGETVHYNVFRKFVNDGAQNGLVIDAMNTNGTNTYSFNYTLDASWAADQMYVIAWVQSVADKTVLNSGSKFIKTTSTPELDEISEGINFQPNPATDIVRLQSNGHFNQSVLEKVEIYGTEGRLFRKEEPNQLLMDYQLNVSSFANGKYVVVMTLDKGIAYKQLIVNR